jgi:hypothetical protein
VSEGGDVVGKYPLRLAFRAREGDVVGLRASKGGDVLGEYLLRLAFRAREGNGDVVGR